MQHKAVRIVMNMGGYMLDTPSVPRTFREGSRVAYHHCGAEGCDGYFATMRGLADHRAFVHNV
jgi:hypothetical protein